MLRPVSASVSLAPPPVRLDKVARPRRQVVVPALEFLEVVVVDEAGLPQVLEEMEVWAARSQRLAEHDVVGCQVLHAQVPRVGAVLVG